MKPRFLSQVIFLSSVASENGDYELIHCNNPETNEPEMKFRISKQFYDMHFDQLALDISEVCSKNFREKFIKIINRVNSKKSESSYWL